MREKARQCVDMDISESMYGGRKEEKCDNVIRVCHIVQRIQGSGSESERNSNCDSDSKSKKSSRTQNSTPLYSIRRTRQGMTRHDWVG